MLALRGGGIAVELDPVTYVTSARVQMRVAVSCAWCGVGRFIGAALLLPW